MSKSYDIFLSYRRSDGKLLARLLKESLEKRGYRVFLDMDELLDSVFDEHIIQAIQTAPIFLLLMTKQCFSRCSQPNDWVRMEIEYAVRAGKNIIPINPDNFFTGFAKSMPSHLREVLSMHQYSVIDTGQLYQVSIEKLVSDRINPAIRRERRKRILNKFIYSLFGNHFIGLASAISENK